MLSRPLRGSTITLTSESSCRFVQVLTQPVDHGGVKRVALFRPVQRNDANAILFLVQNNAHNGSLLLFLRRHFPGTAQRLPRCAVILPAHDSRFFFLSSGLLANICLGGSNFFDQCRNDLKQIAHNTEMRHLEDRRVGILVDRHDLVGPGHAAQMLNCSQKCRRRCTAWG